MCRARAGEKAGTSANIIKHGFACVSLLNFSRRMQGGIIFKAPPRIVSLTNTTLELHFLDTLSDKQGAFGNWEYNIYFNQFKGDV
jgi:hypothetical protein